MKKSRIIFWFSGIIFLLLALFIAYSIDKGVGKGVLEEVGYIPSSVIIVGLLLSAVFIFLLLGAKWGTGMPREFLPNGVSFKKLSERRDKERVEFLVLGMNTSNFFSIPANILLDKNGEEIKEIPDKFQVKKSRRITEKTRLNKRPKTEIVYYLLPITKEK